MDLTANVLYAGGLQTSCTHLRSGNKIETDAPIDNRGKGERFSPTDLMATSLAACILTVMGIKARDKGIDMDGARAELKKTMASNPRRIAKIEVWIQMPDNKYSDEEKHILEKMTHHCPVGNSLHPDLEEIIHLKW